MKHKIKGYRKLSQTKTIAIIFVISISLLYGVVYSNKVSASPLWPSQKQSILFSEATDPNTLEPVKTENPQGTIKPATTNNTCGGPSESQVKLSIDIGCKGLGNPIMDAAFAVIRFMTLGAGIVMIGSAVLAGIQYTASRGDPQATAKAMSRIYSTLGALLLFIFTYAILNWLVPGTLLK